MFRYELNTVFNYHQFEKEGDSQMFMGPNPLSKDKSSGVQIRELSEAGKRLNVDKYRPPGLVRLKNDTISGFTKAYIDLNKSEKDKDAKGDPSKMTEGQRKLLAAKSEVPHYVEVKESDEFIRFMKKEIEKDEDKKFTPEEFAPFLDKKIKNDIWDGIPSK